MLYISTLAKFQGGGVIASQCLNPIDWDHAEAESGQYLLPEYQGKGYGSLMKREFFEWLFANGLQRITEKVKLTNTRNQHVNEKLGMRKYSLNEEYVYYELCNKISP